MERQNGLLEKGKKMRAGCVYFYMTIWIGVRQYKTHVHWPDPIVS